MNVKVKEVWHKTTSIYFIILYIFMFISACRHAGDERKNINVSDIKVSIEVQRFEQDLYNWRSDPAYISKLKNKYGEFFDLYCNHLTSVATPDTTLLKSRLLAFTGDSGITVLYNESQKLFKDFSKEESDLTDAFRRYKVYLPGKVVPNIVTYISGITGTSDYQTVNDSALIGIALDMYLGSNAKYYNDVSYPQYKSRTFSKEYIVTDCMKGWLQSDYEPDVTQTDLLSQVIYEGKIMYCLDLLLPETPDSIKLHYTAQQTEWCKKNEQNIWAFFVDKKMLYETNQAEILKYVTEGPTTNGFPKESPGNIGEWVGWRIVKAYMANHPDVTLPQLLEDKNYKRILLDSKYKPG